VLDVRVHAPLVLGQRAVHGQVAVDRRDALQAVGGVRAAPVHDAGEGQRAGLRADDVQPGGLGDQARVEGVVALERGERPEAAVLLRADRGEHDLAVRRAPAQRGQRVQRGDHAALHVDASATPDAAVGDAAGPGAVPPGDRALGHDVDVAVERQPRRIGARPGDADRQPPQLGARRLLAGMSGMRAQRGEVVAVQVGAQAERGRELAEALERRALVAGDAGHLDERGGVAGERAGVDAGERGRERHGSRGRDRLAALTARRARAGVR
jgi:hypothetical protein